MRGPFLSTLFQKRWLTCIGLGPVFIALLIHSKNAGSSVVLPYTFSSGTTIDPAQVNANFGALRDETNSHEASVNPHQTALSDVLAVNNSSGAHSIDFNENQALRMALENLTTAPSPTQSGRVFYNTTLALLQMDTGSTILTVGGASFVSLSSGITGILPAANGGTGKDLSASTGALSVSAGTFSAGTLSIANGGTGATSQSTAFNALSPLTNLGDTLYGGASGTGTRLAGNNTTTANFYKQVGTGSVSAAPSWAALNVFDIPALGATKITSGQIAVAQGGTGQDLSASTGAISVASGTVSAGTLGVSNGGTGAATLTSNNVLLGNGTSAVQFVAPGSSGNVLTSNGTTWSSTAPASTALTIKTKTADYTILTSDDVVLGNTNSFKLDLPSASAATKPLRVVKIGSDTNSFMVAAVGADTVNGATSFLMNTQYEEGTFISDASSKWYVVNRTYPGAWTTYTMTIGGTVSAPTKGTTAVDLAQWKRISDDSMMIRYQYRQTGGGSNGSGSYLFPLPSPYKIDTTKLNAPGTANKYYHCGSGFASNAADGGSSASNNASVVAYDSGDVMMFTDTNANTATSVSASSFNLSNTNTIFSFTCIVPIAGWH